MLTGATRTISRYIEMIFIQNIETLPFVFTNFLCPWISNLQTLPAGYGAVQGETWGIALGWSLAISQEVIQIDEFTSDLESRLTHAYGLYMPLYDEHMSNLRNFDQMVMEMGVWFIYRLQVGQAGGKRRSSASGHGWRAIAATSIARWHEHAGDIWGCWSWCLVA